MLVDLGYMRDQGEGIPRMFAEMEGSFLPAPEFVAEPTGFRVTLRDTPTLTSADTAFIAAIGDEDLTTAEFRALLEAHRNDKVDNARMRRLTGMDTLGASQLLRGLRDRQLLELHGAGSASFYNLHSRLRRSGASIRRSDVGESGSDVGESGADLGEFDADLGELRSDVGESGADLGELGPDVGESPVDEMDVPARLAKRIASLGRRPRHATLRPIIRELVKGRELTASQIARVLGRKNVENLVAKLLTPMVADRELVRTHPNEPNHPRQAYRAEQARCVRRARCSRMDRIQRTGERVQGAPALVLLSSGVAFRSTRPTTQTPRSRTRVSWALLIARRAPARPSSLLRHCEDDGTQGDERHEEHAHRKGDA